MLRTFKNDLGLCITCRIDDAKHSAIPHCSFWDSSSWNKCCQCNPLYTARELEHQGLKDAELEAIIIFANSAHVLEKVIPNTPVKHVMVTEIGDLLKFQKLPC